MYKSSKKHIRTKVFCFLEIMAVPWYAFASSIVMVCVAFIVAIQYHVHLDMHVGLTFFIGALVSTYHHSRLHTWFVRDALYYADALCVLTYLSLWTFLFRRRTSWWVVLLICSVLIHLPHRIFGTRYNNALQIVSGCHALAHILFAGAVWYHISSK